MTDAEYGKRIYDMRKREHLCVRCGKKDEMTDIEILEREKQCVQRKNCDRDCLRCDLLMSEEEILKAYDHAISALRAQQEAENK